MHENKIKESLKIKPVSLKYLDQYNELLRYVFQVTDRELEESADREKYKIYGDLLATNMKPTYSAGSPTTTNSCRRYVSIRAK